MTANDPRLSRATEVDTTVATAARLHNYLLGGTDNFAVDRQAAEHMSAKLSGGIEAARGMARAQRAFLGRAVRYLAGAAGTRQFLDVGCGIPVVGNTHEIAQHVAPESRVVYVDVDPVVVAYAHQLLRGHPEGETGFLWGDLRDPDGILDAAADTLDFTQPVAVLLVGVVQFIVDDDDPQGLVARLVDRVPSGSHLVVLHLANDADRSDEMVELARRHNQGKVRSPLTLRSRDDVGRFFDGLELVEPGLVPVDTWRPDEPEASGSPSVQWAGIGAKP